MFLKWYVRTAFPELARDVLKASPDYNKRPYWALIYAGAAAAANQSDAASHELRSWLKDYDGKAGHSSAPGYSWYSVRVLSSLINIVEESTLRMPAVPAVLRDFQTNNYKELIEALDIGFVRQGRQSFLRKDGRLKGDKTIVSIDDEKRSCEINSVEDEDLQNLRLSLLAAFLQIAEMINFIDKATDDPDYITKYSPEVIGYLQELNAVNFYCLRVMLDDNDKAAQTSRIQRAAILRLNAKAILAEANEEAAGRSPGELKTSLNQALFAAEAARRILFQDRMDAQSKRYLADDYFEEIKPSEVIDEFGKVESTLSLLASRAAGQ